ncbi:hypothetical protein BGZ72_001873 [Mortierella alpina]|nr:hypothetical protein BGZ72_001873 [Mortierella alpina]
MDKITSFVQKSDTNAIAVAIFGAIGAAIVAFKALRFLKVLVDVFVRPGINLKKYGAGKGGWAVITGASDGIGKEFATQLASKKLNVVLVSRTESKLKALAEEIEQKYNVETKVLAMDFTKGDERDYAALQLLISPIEVTILVNNVGTNHEIPTFFEDESDKTIDNIVEVNINAIMRVTKLVVPQMAARWSQAIGAELAPKGIRVQNVNTYFVVSAMSKIRRPSMTAPLPKAYVRAVLSKIGVPGGASTPYTSTPFYSHAIANWLIENVFSRSFWVGYNYDLHVDIRKRALRKREREAAAAKKD